MVCFVVTAFLFQHGLDLLQFRFGQMFDADESFRAVEMARISSSIFA